MTRHARTLVDAANVPVVHRFATHEQASAALAARVAADLEDAVAERGEASLAVPGGTTPDQFLTVLGSRTLDWRRVTVLLTDERWVSPGHPRSNTGLVERTLGRKGGRYRWYPLWRPGVEPDDAATMLDSESTGLAWPLDVVVLGMGEDGHVASLFPGDEKGFASRARRFIAVAGPDGEPRVSLSADALLGARHLYVLLRGRTKLAKLESAMGGDLPVARVLRGRAAAVHVFAGD